MRSVVREWLLKIALLVMSSLMALGGAEIAVRIIHPISDGRDNVTMDGVPIESWFEPGSVYRQVSNEYDAKTTITSDGHRVPGTDGNPDVVFLGDSFTYGWGLPDEDTFASIYCTSLQLTCANLGVPGTGTAKQLDRLEQFLGEHSWRPREVKLFFFGMSGSWSAGNDFVDNYDERGLSDARAGRGQSPSPAAGPPAAAMRPGLAERAIGWQSAVLQRSNLMRLVKYYWGPSLKALLLATPGEDRLAEALRYTRQNLERLHAISRRAGFEYRIYLIVPVQDVILGTYPRTLEALQGVSPIPVISTGHLFVDDPQHYYFSYDGHINANGSRRIGEFLVAKEREAHAGR
jgi:hypothetical protein